MNLFAIDLKKGGNVQFFPIRKRIIRADRETHSNGWSDRRRVCDIYHAVATWKKRQPAPACERWSDPSPPAFVESETVPNFDGVCSAKDLGGSVLPAPAARAGRFNADAFARLHPKVELAGQGLNSAVVSDDGCVAGFAIATALQAPRTTRTAVGQ